MEPFFPHPARKDNFAPTAADRTEEQGGKNTSAPEIVPVFTHFCAMKQVPHCCWDGGGPGGGRILVDIYDEGRDFFMPERGQS